MTIYADLFALPEEQRIAVIGKQVVEGGKAVAFIVEDNEKADRYIRKLLLDYNVKVLARGVGPVKNTVFVKVGPCD